MEYVLLLVGFVLLVKGADFFVEGSSSLAKILKVPSVIIGLTIVAMGTSAPEASVSINAALGGSNDIAISNVVGSNIFNGLVVVGICAFVRLSDERGDLKAGHARQYSGHADSVPHVSRWNAWPRRRFSSSGRNGSLHHMHDPFRSAQP